MPVNDAPRITTDDVTTLVPSSAFGVKAVELVLAQQFGMMVCLEGNDIASIPLKRATGALKTVDPRLYEIARIFFG